jgi:hypothetical protein
MAAFGFWMSFASKGKLLDRVAGFGLRRGALSPSGCEAEMEFESPEATAEAGCEVITNCKESPTAESPSLSFRTQSGVREKNELSVRRSYKKIDSSKFVKSPLIQHKKEYEKQGTFFLYRRITNQRNLQPSKQGISRELKRQFSGEILWTRNGMTWLITWQYVWEW